MAPTHVFSPSERVGTREVDEPDGKITVTKGPLCAVCGCLADDPQHQ